MFNSNILTVPNYAWKSQSHQKELWKVTSSGFLTGPQLDVVIDGERLGTPFRSQIDELFPWLQVNII